MLSFVELLLHVTFPPLSTYLCGLQEISIGGRCYHVWVSTPCPDFT